jgi:hypothetical protein
VLQHRDFTHSVGIRQQSASGRRPRGARHSAEIQNCLLEANHSAEINLKQLKPPVQKYRRLAEKFDNRLLAPSGYRVNARYRGRVPSTV